MFCFGTLFGKHLNFEHLHLIHLMLDIIPIMVITFDTFEYLHLILVLELECSFFSSSDV